MLPGNVGQFVAPLFEPHGDFPRLGQRAERGSVGRGGADGTRSDYSPTRGILLAARTCSRELPAFFEATSALPLLSIYAANKFPGRTVGFITPVSCKTNFFFPAFLLCDFFVRIFSSHSYFRRFFPTDNVCCVIMSILVLSMGAKASTLR